VRDQKESAQAEEFGEKIHVAESTVPDAESVLVQSVECRMLSEALEELPVNFREVLISRELEGLSYKEIADVIDVPIGTVMSSLARGRERRRELLLRARGKEGLRGLR
jgi:RNA polymerase sigma factor (sigma-70 family)